MSTTRSCLHCKSLFKPKNKLHKYCNSTCRENSTAYQKKQPQEKECKGCKSKFTKAGPYKYCTPECRSAYYNSLKPKRNLIVKFETKPNLKEILKRDTFNLEIGNEKEFVEWFKENYFLFGIKKIIKLDPFFPDCRAELFSGQLVDIELEYHSSNFAKHKHPPECDLIISYLKGPYQTHISNIPIIAVFENYQRRVFTSYFKNILNFCNYLTSSVLTNKPDGYPFQKKNVSLH